MELYPGATSGGGHIRYMYSVAMTRDDLARNDRATQLQKWIRRINHARRILAYRDTLPIRYVAVPVAEEY